jgi:hypothetical protein
MRLRRCCSLESPVDTPSTGGGVTRTPIHQYDEKVRSRTHQNQELGQAVTLISQEAICKARVHILIWSCAAAAESLAVATATRRDNNRPREDKDACDRSKRRKHLREKGSSLKSHFSPELSLHRGLLRTALLSHFPIVSDCHLVFGTAGSSSPDNYLPRISLFIYHIHSKSHSSDIKGMHEWDH